MLIGNKHPDYLSPLPPADVAEFGRAAAAEVERFLTFRENHKPTPLYSFAALAHVLGIESVHIKDESHRLDGSSFKALGSSYAIMRIVLDTASKRLGRVVEVGEIHSPSVRDISKRMTFACATTGNQGLAVASAAALVGAKTVVFVSSSISPGRIASIERWGAQVKRIEGTYEDALAEADRVCAQSGWFLISDLSRTGDERVARHLMQGYAPVICEALRCLSEVPTHIFIQAGIGALAAAIAGHLFVSLGSKKPAVIVVEPERAACLFESAARGNLQSVACAHPTIMAMLGCFEPSHLAWRILSRQADFFMTVNETDAVVAMNHLARPAAGDPAIVAGESGGVGLAGLMKAAQNEDWRKVIGLNQRSRVLLFNTEGATDLLRYNKIVGLSPIIVSAGLPCDSA